MLRPRLRAAPNLRQTVDPEASTAWELNLQPSDRHDTWTN
jgi:hypothetical protein